MDTVRLQNGLLIHGGQTGIWAALGNGFYEEENIDCTITRGYGSETTLQNVAEGEVEIGETDLTVMLMARGKGMSLKGVGVLYHRAQHVIYSLSHSGINSPADLRGKSVAVTEADAGFLLFPAFLNSIGLVIEDVELILIPAEQKVPTLLAGKVNALLTYVINGPGVEAGAAEQDLQVRGLVWADHGFDLVSNGFVASQTLLKERPDLVRRFLRATYRGIVWAFSHPEKASDLFSACNPGIDRRLARLQWERTIPFIVTEGTRRDGLGFLSMKKLDDSFRVMRGLFETGDDSPEGAFTNDFLPEKAARLAL